MMDQEPTELAPSENETGSIYAWGAALDYDDVDECPTTPTRLTPRRITSLSVAASLVLIAVAGATALVTRDRWGAIPRAYIRAHR